MKMFKTLASFALTFTLLATSMPASANPNVPSDRIPFFMDDTEIMETDPVGEDNNGIVITGGVDGIDYTRSEDGTITVISSTPLVLDGKGRLNTTEYIVLGNEEDACDIHVTIKNLKIKANESPAINIVDSYKKDVYLTIKGDNELTGSWGYAAIAKNSEPEDGTLFIDGDGSLKAVGGYMGAGIGSDSDIPTSWNHDRPTSNIVINGGTITVATSHGSTVVEDYAVAAGIGSCGNGAASNITINDGTITAQIDSYGAGIGGGSAGKAIGITINGGLVNTSSTHGTGIGGGKEGNANSIRINGGTVISYGADGCAGIGGGGLQMVRILL